VIGYQAAWAAAHEALVSDRELRAVLVDSGELSAAEAESVLDARRLIPSTERRDSERQRRDQPDG